MNKRNGTYFIFQ